MKISSNYHQQLPQSTINKEQTNPTFEANKTLPKFTKKAKLGAVTALFLLPTLGIINHCNNANDNNNNIEVVDTPVDTSKSDEEITQNINIVVGFIKLIIKLIKTIFKKNKN